MRPACVQPVPTGPAKQQPRHGADKPERDEVQPIHAGSLPRNFTAARRWDCAGAQEQLVNAKAAIDKHVAGHQQHQPRADDLAQRPSLSNSAPSECQKPSWYPRAQSTDLAAATADRQQASADVRPRHQITHIGEQVRNQKQRTRSQDHSGTQRTPPAQPRSPHFRAQPRSSGLRTSCTPTLSRAATGAAPQSIRPSERVVMRKRADHWLASG